ncbi:MAG: DUF4038 domain-containing protein [Kiritimatiellae bacterium]|nr:DUF4038 domain-containing protein [Kiritimatiellia bacterium]
MPRVTYGMQNQPGEWSYTSGKAHDDPFNEIELEAIFTGPSGTEHKVPAFWAGEQEWRVRFAPREVGTYSYRTVCSDNGNGDLHGREGTFEVAAYDGNNPLQSHGPLQVSVDKRYLCHADGTPFFWLGDTWWMGLCARLKWPEDFQELTADRVAKGFSVIQIVAGPYPDMPAFDPRNENEAGQPWEPDWERVNPAYYDMADRRIRHLVQMGLVPCILACWGYYLPWMGVAKMKRHWRNLVARYGAYPVVWCIAGETAMPWYLSETKQEDVEEQRKGWAEVARYLREIDPYGHPITAHPRTSGRDDVEDDSVLDFEMLQTGHSGYDSLAKTVKSARDGVAREPRMPVVNGEVCYEGIFERSWADVQRLMFLSSMLSGACGYTYGANGIWQFNTPDALFGASPHGSVWGNRLWREAASLDGSTHLGVCKGLFERFEWWQFEPHQDWIEPSAGEDSGLQQPYAAGIPDKVRVVYLPRPYGGWQKNRPVIKKLEPKAAYTAFYFDPKDAKEYPVGEVKGDTEGNWQIAKPPITQDWVLVLQRAAGGKRSSGRRG